MMENIAAVIEGPGSISLVQTAIQPPGPEEVTVKVSYVALCGSDVKLYQGTYTAPHKYPVVIGHEWVGKIVEIGNAVSKLKVGDTVTGDCSLYCGTCDYCKRGYKNHCLSVEKKGITVDGACERFITVNRRHVYRCPDLPDPRALVLAEPLAVTVEAVFNRLGEADMKKIRRALVIGAGGIGALSVFMLKDAQVAEVTVVDLAPDKLAIVDSFGFEGVRVATDLHDPALVEGCYDLIIEGAGSSAALQKAVELAAPRGYLVCVGHQTQMELDFGLIMKKSLTLITSIGSTGGFEKAIELIGRYSSKVVKLQTRIVKLSEIEAFFSTNLASVEDVKVLIDLQA